MYNGLKTRTAMSKLELNEEILMHVKKNLELFPLILTMKFSSYNLSLGHLTLLQDCL